MDTTPRGFKYSLAAKELIAGKSHAEAAAAAGVSVVTVKKWHNLPRFKQLLAGYRRRIDEQITEYGIANKQARQRARQREHRALERVIEARAADALNPDSPLHGVPGAETGLMYVSKQKVVPITEPDPTDPNAEPRVIGHKAIALEYKVDASILTALKDLKTDATKDQLDTHDPAANGPGNNLRFTINYPVLSHDEALKMANEAATIALPAMQKRLLDKA